MSLDNGTLINTYKIIGTLGAGGMGEVYRATDTRLDREVAIKVLPASMVRSADRVAGFQREAKMLASLNHPKIAAIYGFEEAGERQLLILELVEGPTLAERIAEGRLTVDQSLEIAKQLAEALEDAHSKGIIHRDLKPANIKLTSDGAVKVLDFGLAKAMSEQEPGGNPEDTPTITGDFTTPGLILGTAAYMSPEQARGLPVDQRCDIWAFGCILYECLTGRSPFRRSTATDSIAALLSMQPEWESLPAETPPSARWLLRRCLAKEPRNRLHHIADARVELEATDNPDHESSEVVESPTSATSKSATIGLLAAVVLLLTFVAWLLWRPVAPVAKSGYREFSLRLDAPRGVHTPVEDTLRSLALSPDGQRLVFQASNDGKPALFLYDLRQANTRVVLNALASGVFFSPDGKWIGFENAGKLKTLRLDGGKPEELLEIASLIGGCWGPDGMIYYVPSINAGIWRIPAEGATADQAEQVTQPLPDELGHFTPQIVPDGSTLLFTAWRKDVSDAQVVAFSLKTNQRKVLCERASQPFYTSTGHLTYARSGTLMAVPLDLETLQLQPPHLPLADDLYHSLLDGRAAYYFSNDGLLVYARGGPWSERRRIVWVDSDGKLTPTKIPIGAYGTVSLSPGQRKVALTMFDGDRLSVGVHDFDTGDTAQLASETFDCFPVWVGEQQLAFTSFPNGPFDVYLVDSDLSTAARPLVQGQLDQATGNASANGDSLFYIQSDPQTGFDLWSLSTTDGSAISATGGHEQQPVFDSQYSELSADVSPDGEFIAFSSDRTGRPEVYVQRRSGPEGAKQVSRNGGTEPRWSHDGSELYYRSANDLCSVTFELDDGKILLGRPQVLFSTQGFVSTISPHSYDVGSDGRFLFIEDLAPFKLIAVVNWFDKLRDDAR